jgi:hypothetical protein
LSTIFAELSLLAGPAAAEHAPVPAREDNPRQWFADQRRRRHRHGPGLAVCHSMQIQHSPWRKVLRSPRTDRIVGLIVGSVMLAAILGSALLPRRVEADAPIQVTDTSGGADAR